MTTVWARRLPKSLHQLGDGGPLAPVVVQQRIARGEPAQLGTVTASAQLLVERELDAVRLHELGELRNVARLEGASKRSQGRGVQRYLLCLLPAVLLYSSCACVSRFLRFLPYHAELVRWSVSRWAACGVWGLHSEARHPSTTTSSHCVHGTHALRCAQSLAMPLDQSTVVGSNFV